MQKTWVHKRSGKPGWWVGWYESGKRKAKALPTKHLADHFAKIKYHQLNTDVFVSSIGVDWLTMKTEYETSRKVAGNTASSIYDAMLSLSNFERVIGPVNSKQLTQAVVDAFILGRKKERVQDRRSEKTKEKHAKAGIVKTFPVISRDTLNKDISNLRTFIHWLEEKRYLDEGSIKLKKVKVDEKDVQPLKDRQIVNLLVSAESYMLAWKIRVLLALVTGLRKSDIESLEVTDIHFDTNSIDTRSRKTRKVMLNRPLPDGVMKELTRYVESLPDGQVSLWPDTNTHKKWKAIREQAGLPSLRFQDLRVNFSVAVQDTAGGLEQAQDLLEHSDKRTTEEYYSAESTVAKRRSAVNRLPVSKWL